MTSFVRCDAFEGKFTHTIHIDDFKAFMEEQVRTKEPQPMTSFSPIHSIDRCQIQFRFDVSVRPDPNTGANLVKVVLGVSDICYGDSVPRNDIKISATSSHVFANVTGLQFEYSPTEDELMKLPDGKKTFTFFISIGIPYFKTAHTNFYKPEIETQAMLDDPELADVTFICQGKQIMAHKFILAMKSEVFKAMLYGEVNYIINI